jgi:glucose-1-phosphate adenylyltransferase
MLRQNTNALGIIFPNSYDNTVPELVTERAMASIPFAGRYRMVDFVLSSMANCGISNVSIVVRKNYHSLMDHLGTGREWDMARRHGGLNIVPPFAEKGVRIYSGRVEALGSILSFLEHQKEKYVVMSDANIAVNYDFNALLAAHQASGADVTVAYQKTEIPEGRKNDNYTLTIDADGRVTELLFNDYRSGVQNLDLNIYVLERETLIKLVKDATARGLIYFERDILAHNVNILNIHALEYTGYVAHICDMKSYFDENLKLIDDRNLEALFPKEQETSIEIKGRCLVTGLPKVINVSSTEMLEAFEEPVERILEAVHGVLERTPPELVADISNNGIVMTGGGSLVDGFDKLIEARTGIHTVVAEGAISCVAEGTGRSLDSLNSMTDGTVNLSRRKQMN